MQDLWQGHYQILPIIQMKVFIKLNINLSVIVKNEKMCGIKYNVCGCCREYTNDADDLVVRRCLCCIPNNI